MGVLLDNLVTFLEIYNKKFKTEHIKEDIKYWEYFEELKMTTEQFFKLFYKTFDYLEDVPFIDEEAPTYMKKLNKVNDLFILTALDPNYRNLLVKQLESCQIKQPVHYKEMI